MKLYVWTSEWLQGYADGYLITVAGSDEEARQKILAQALADGRYEANDQECKLHSDLAKAPVNPEAILIWGSD